MTFNSMFSGSGTGLFTPSSALATISVKNDPLLTYIQGAGSAILGPLGVATFWSQLIGSVDKTQSETPVTPEEKKKSQLLIEASAVAASGALEAMMMMNFVKNPAAIAAVGNTVSSGINAVGGLAKSGAGLLAVI